MNHDLEQFIGSARWFGGKGRDFTLTAVRRLGTLPASGDAPRVAVDLAEITYADAAGPDEPGSVEFYQLPLAFRSEREERLAHALIGEWEDDDFGPSHVYDAVHDRDAMALWLDAFAAAREGHTDHGLLTFHRLPGHEIDVTAHSTLFSGEQSNSSVAYGDDSLMKVFRKLTPGVNPDIQIHDVLTEAGSDDVAALYGWLDTVDPSTGATGSVMQLAMLQQFLRTGSDGWDLAQSSVRTLFTELDVPVEESGGDSSGESERLGLTLADVHRTLAAAFPTQVLDATEVDALADRMRTRLADALEVVPELAAFADQVGRIFAALADLTEVPVQRVHGDLHLGQTLRTVKGWKLVDFEGEPAKPLADRLLPDSRWRDVAGMLRSFDYAAAVVARSFNEDDEDEANARRIARGGEWAERNRAAFVTAYAGRDLTPDEQLLLDAYEADKAVYECVYEARNRPTWLGIPLAGITRITNR